MVSSSKSKEDRQKEKLLSQARKNNKPKDWFVILITTGVLVLLAVIAIFIVAQNNQSSKIASVKSSEVSPRTAINDGFTVTKAGLKSGKAYNNSMALESKPYSSKETNISMYIDYACPHCAEFESENLSQIQSWLDKGEIDSFSIHPMAFLSPYSVEAANAASCVAEYDPSNFLKAHSAMTLAYESAPSGKQLVKLLKESGVNTSAKGLNSCIRGEKYNKFVEAVTKKAQSGPIPETSLGAKEGIQGTPAVFVNGEQYAGNPDKTIFASFVSYIKQGGTAAEINKSNENQTQIGGK